MYGISVPFSWHKEWEAKTGKDFHETFKEYMKESSDNRTVYNKEGIFCLFGGRDGKFIIIGQVILKSDNKNPFLGSGKPITLPEFDELEKAYIESSVKEHFGLEGKFHYYFITHYKKYLK
jgi:hypothetical protein